MSCDCCCIKTLRLCKASVCDDIDFGITAQVPGEHKLILDFLGIQIIITKDFAFDDEITFPASSLNESFTYSGKLYDPSGKQIIIRKDDVDYDCIEFTTNITIAA